MGWRDGEEGALKAREVSCLVVGDGVACKVGGLFDGLSK